MPKDEFYQSILENLDSGVYFVDRKRQITYWNRGAELITGYSKDTVQGRFCGDGLLQHVDEEGNNLCKDGCPLAEVMETGEPNEVHVFLHHAEGHRVPVVVRAMPIRDADGKITGAVETFNDNSALVKARSAAREFKQKSIQDPLTGLGNRRFIEVRIESVLKEFKHFGTVSGLFYLDIDHFKSINDTYGHKVGDQVLQTVSKTLLNNIREYDFLGRWGGDEFIVIINNVDQVELIQIGEKLRVLVANSCIETNGIVMCPTISIGATLLREDDTTESFLERGDQLLYQCKRQGRNCLNFAH